MLIGIQSRGFALSDGLKAHVERRLRTALGSISERVQSVVVRLTDVNGPRGGVDKHCVMHAQLPSASPVIIKQADANLYLAIDRAADRLGRTVSRRKEHALRNRRRHSMPSESHPTS